MACWNLLVSPLVKSGSGSFLKKDLSKLLTTLRSCHFCRRQSTQRRLRYRYQSPFVLKVPVNCFFFSLSLRIDSILAFYDHVKKKSRSQWFSRLVETHSGAITLSCGFLHDFRSLSHCYRGISWNLFKQSLERLLKVFHFYLLDNNRLQIVWKRGAQTC